MGIQPKLKKCSQCELDKHIWKNYEGQKWCKECWGNNSSISKLKPTVKRAPIARVSSKLAKKQVAYKVIRDLFMKNHPVCQAKLAGCSSTATECHHKRGRGEYLLDSSTFLAVCNSCHHWIELNSKAAKELGFSESRLGK